MKVASSNADTGDTTLVWILDQTNRQTNKRSVKGVTLESYRATSVNKYFSPVYWSNGNNEFK